MAHRPPASFEYHHPSDASLLRSARNAAGLYARRAGAAPRSCRAVTFYALDDTEAVALLNGLRAGEQTALASVLATDLEEFLGGAGDAPWPGSRVG